MLKKIEHEIEDKKIVAPKVKSHERRLMDIEDEVVRLNNHIVLLEEHLILIEERVGQPEVALR